MLIQSSLPSSIEAALFYASDHGKQDFLCDWMPGAETWQMCPTCVEQPNGGCRNAVSIAEENKNVDNSCSLDIPRSSSQLSTVSTMAESSALNFVYKRRKLQGNSVAICSAQGTTKRSGDSLSAISSDNHLVSTKERDPSSQVEHEPKTVGAPVIPPLVCDREPHVSKTESTNGPSLGEQHCSDVVPKSSMHKIIEVNSVNDSCSSSKSNMELVSPSMKTEADESGECSSSSILVAEVKGKDLSSKDLCIFILGKEGLLEGVWPISSHTSSEGVGISSDRNCSRSCKICGNSESALNMLICDHCEEAFHASCCIPRMKKIPKDEWLCHSCLKNNCKILKEMTRRKSFSITSEMGRCRNTSSKGDSNPIVLMLTETEPYTTVVRIGKGFQAEVPDWSGPVNNDVDVIGEPVEMDPSEFVTLHEWNFNQPSRLSSIGNWLQCREVIDGIGGTNGTICGKWRRAPLFEVQTDNWECFCCVHWDPAHSDCATPQELETDQVLKQLKYIQTLGPQLAAKRRKFEHTMSDGSPNPTENAINLQA